MTWPVVFAVGMALWPAAATPRDGNSPAESADLADLAGPDPNRRSAAVVRMGIRGRAEDLRRIAPLLDAPDASLRLVAARALVGAGDPGALARLAMEAAGEIAGARLEALTVLREAESLPAEGRRAAERALADSDPAMRLAALELLGVHASADSASAVAGVLGDGNRDVRLAAVRVLGLAPDARGLVPLLDRLETADRAERIAIIEALGGFRDRHPLVQAGPAVLRQLADVNEDVRIAATDALGRLGWAPAIPALRGLAMQPTRDRAARRAAVALGAIAAATAAGHHVAGAGSGAAVDALIQLLRQPPPSNEVIAALHTAGAAAAPPLGRVLQDGSTTSAIAAAQILGDLQPSDAVGPLVGTLSATDSAAIAISAARALAHLRDRRGVPVLAATVTATKWGASSGVKEAALDALSAIASAVPPPPASEDRAASVVETAAKDGDARVRRAALVLARVTHAGLRRETLAARLNDVDGAVRLQAVRAAAALPSLRPAALLLDLVIKPKPPVPWTLPLPTEGDAIDEAISASLEAALSEADHPALAKALEQTAPSRRHLLLRGWTATAGGVRPLPPRVEDWLLATLAAGNDSAQSAAEALSASAVTEGTVRTVVARFTTLPPGVRGRLCPLLAAAGSRLNRVGRIADERLATAISRDDDEGVRAAAAWAARARANVPGMGLRPTSWIRVRLTAPDGTPLGGRWARIASGNRSFWAQSDGRGEIYARGLPPGGYRVFTDSADQPARIAAMASGRSPASTPVGP